MKNKSKLMMLAGAMALVLEATPALGLAPGIESFGRNGELVCTNLQPGSTASVEWAPAVTGPWTNSWAGLEAVTVGANGAMRVSVPMFYRVRVVAQGTNPAPSGMALIPAGSFTMGDTFNDWPPESGANQEIPVHTVHVSAFYMDKYEVTKALWDEVRVWANTSGYNLGSVGLGKATNHPVQTVNWYDMVKWCNARSQKEELTPAYYTDVALTQVYKTGQVAPYVNWNAGYRLPTEAEWEKAARGGVRWQRFPWSGTNNITSGTNNTTSGTNNITHSQANYDAAPSSYTYDVNPTNGYHPTFNDGVEPYTSPVGYFAANGYGLYDMAGNVFEWCWDWYGSYSGGSQTDPRGPTSGSLRVLRGGSWNFYAINCRSAHRYFNYPSIRLNSIGFRSVLPPGQ